MSNAWKVAERKMAKALGQWAFGRKDAFSRMPLQGRMLEEYLGDIIVNEKAEDDVRKLAAAFLSRVLIDVKRRKSNQSATGWHFEQLLTSPKHQILAWWSKLADAARKVQKIPILIVTRGDRRWFVLLDAANARGITQLQTGELEHIAISCCGDLLAAQGGACRITPAGFKYRLVAVNFDAFRYLVRPEQLCLAEDADRAAAQ
jgi:hypothetical protein